MGDQDAQRPNTTIARLEEEKGILWAIIADLESWMFGEGCFVSERTKAKLDIARKVMAPAKEDVERYRQRLFLCYQEDKTPKDRRRKVKHINCSVSDCNEEARARGMCANHYQQDYQKRKKEQTA